MAHDVFISYSNKDKPITDGVCANLEAAGIRCWMAPRDIGPGEDWPTAIAQAISQSKVMVLVFSSHSNSSDEVSRELFLAANAKVVIIPFKIENVEPEAGKQYYLGRTHWLDAMNPPTQEQIRTLVERVRSFVPAVNAPGVAPPMPVPLPLPVNPPAPGPQAKRSWFRPQYLLVPGALAFCVPLMLLLVWVAFQLLPSQTPSSTVTPAPTLEASSPQPQYIVHDDFSDETSGWAVSTDKIAERFYQDGEYFIHIRPSSAGSISELSSVYGDNKNAWSIAAIGNLTDVAIEVDTRFISGKGAYGIIVYYQGKDSFYFVEITPDRTWDLVQSGSGKYNDLVLFQFTPALRSGKSVNRVRLELSKSAKLYANDQLISSINIPYMTGEIGLWATSWTGGEFEVAFDNFVVTRLP